MRLFKDLSWGFYHGSIAVHGKPTRIDILTIYDAAKLKRVLHQYEGRNDRSGTGSRSGILSVSGRHCSA